MFIKDGFRKTNAFKMKYFKYTIILCFVLISKVSGVNNSIGSVPEDAETDYVGGDLETMSDLYDSILSNYDPRIRPIANQSQAIKVNTKFVPQSLLEFDTAEQKFSVLGFFRIYWNDEVLTWEPAEYGGTNVVRIPVNEIWTPSLIIRKAFDGGGLVGSPDTDIAKVSNIGDVQWVPEGIYSVVCDVNIQHYPFDEQLCAITYYVSDETVKSVILDHVTDVDLSEYSENSAWAIVDVRRRKYLKFNSMFIDIEFHLRRRANFTTFTLIMPLFMLAFLNICIFLVPIGSGEKGSFAITIFLSYGIFVTIVSNTLPHNSLQVSYFVLFITVLLFLSVISVFYTIIQAKLMSSMGDNECPWKCLRPKRSPSTKVMPLNDEEDSVDNVNDKDTESYTWIMFMEKLDSYLFVVFFVLILVLTIVFFSLV